MSYNTHFSSHVTILCRQGPFLFQESRELQIFIRWTMFYSQVYGEATYQASALFLAITSSGKPSNNERLIYLFKRHCKKSLTDTDTTIQLSQSMKLVVYLCFTDYCGSTPGIGTGPLLWNIFRLRLVRVECFADDIDVVLVVNCRTSVLRSQNRTHIDNKPKTLEKYVSKVLLSREAQSCSMPLLCGLQH